MQAHMNATRVVSLAEKLALFEDTWSPKLVAEVNDMYVKLVKLEGEFLWHDHDWEDEMFFVVSGRLTIRFRVDGAEWESVAGPGEFIVVPHGIEHMPVCAEPTQIMLFEPKATVNTGNAESERRTEPEWL